MGFRDWPSWLKGGMIGLVIGLIVSITSGIYIGKCVNEASNVDLMICAYILTISFPIYLLNLLEPVKKIGYLYPNFIEIFGVDILGTIANIIIGFVFGFILGWLYGKFKSKNQTENLSKY